MASLRYELLLRAHANSIATYAYAGDDGSLTAAFHQDELTAEFGLVPTGIDVIVRVDSMTQEAPGWRGSTDADRAEGGPAKPAGRSDTMPG